MNNETTIKDETTIVSADRSIAISTVGYMCIAITWWMLSMLMAGWFPMMQISGIAAGVLYAVGSILLVITGILAVIYGKEILDGMVFLGMSGLLFSLHVGHLASLSGEPDLSGYYGWFSLLWAIYFCYLWIASMRRKGDTIRMLFLLLFWIGALIAAIGGWVNSNGLEMLSGYFFLISAILAFIVSARVVLAGIQKQSTVEETITVTSTPPPAT